MLLPWQTFDVVSVIIVERYAAPLYVPIARNVSNNVYFDRRSPYFRVFTGTNTGTGNMCDQRIKSSATTMHVTTCQRHTPTVNWLSLDMPFCFINILEMCTSVVLFSAVGICRNSCQKTVRRSVV